MKMKKSQFREDTATYIQMIHLLNEYNPGWKIILIGVLLEGIFPFIAIFLSSMLLDALYSGRSMQGNGTVCSCRNRREFCHSNSSSSCHKREKYYVVGHAASNDRTHHDKNNADGL